MRGVSTGSRNAVLWVALLCVLTAQVALADETIGPPPPPEARIQPPIGAASQSQITPVNATRPSRGADVVAHARIQPPIGAPEDNAIDVFLTWLKGTTARLLRGAGQ